MKKLFVFLLLGVFMIMPLIQAEVTLNSPANNAIITSNITTYNASGSLTGGLILLNMSLWTNETGTWQIKNTTTFEIGSSAEETSGIAMVTTSGGVIGKSGWKIQVESITNITNITKHASTTCTKGYIQTAYASGIIGTATFVGQVASFSGGVVLNTGIDYWILCDNDGGSYVYQHGPTTAIPVDSGNINWNNRIDQLGDESTDIANTLTFIGYDNSGTTDSTQTWTNVYTAGQDVLWNVEICADDQTCDFAVSNYTFSVPFFEVSRTHNASSFETASETFSINISNSQVITAAKLIYKGTEYSTTKSGDVYSSTINIPTGVANNSVRWKFTYNSQTFHTNFSYQNVSETVFTLCNATYTSTFLNISFKDEEDLEVINASIPTSTFEYWLGDGTVTKTFALINNTDNFNYEFCATPDRTFNFNTLLQYKQGSEYPQRVFSQDGGSLTNETTNLTLYLLGVSDGLFVTFQVLNVAEQPISNVDISATRILEGSPTPVAQGTTDAAGSVTFWLNPDFQHTITFEKIGLDTETLTIFPTQTAYTVSMGGGTVTEPDQTRGVSLVVQPQDAFLFNDTIHVFNYTISSAFWNLEQFGYTLIYSNGTTIATQLSTATSGGVLSTSANTFNLSWIRMDYHYLINETYTNASRIWYIQTTEGTEYSISNFFSRLTIYINAGMFGFDDFGKALISFLILVLVAGGLSYRYGINSEVSIMGIIFGLVLVLDVGLGLIPNPQLATQAGLENIITIITGIILFGFLAKEELR